MANVEPNQYLLHSHHLKIAYKTDGFQGQPTLHYQDGKLSKDFKGNEIRTENTEAGSLVTVTTVMSVDTVSTTFSILIPAVVLASNSDQEHFSTLGIETQHKTMLVLPPTGARETYEVHTLNGTAARVIVPPVREFASLIDPGEIGPTRLRNAAAVKMRRTLRVLGLLIESLSTSRTAALRETILKYSTHPHFLSPLYNIDRKFQAEILC